MSKEQFKVIKKTALQQLIETINKCPDKAKDMQWLLHVIDGLYHQEIESIKRAYIDGVKDGLFEIELTMRTDYTALSEDYFKKEFQN